MKTLIVLALLMMYTTAIAEKRIALVIGNATYKTAPLKNPVNDASSIARALSQLGFKVTTKLNANKRTMKTAISQFGKALAQPNTVGLFYFAGHGIQVKNRNYLIPIHAVIDGEADVEFEGIDAGRILGQMDNAGNNLNLVILDACRDNPFGGSFRSAKRGLARVNVPKGSMILYAASPGERAADGTGKNSIFAKNLLNKLKQPGLTVDQVFKQTASAVYIDTAKKQPVLISSNAEDTFIQYMDQDDPSQMRLYLQQYPAGKLSALFKLKSKEILEYTLTVRSNVNDDKVTIDGKNYGSTGLDLKLKPGEHTIKIEKEGYKPFEKTIQLASNQTVRGILTEVSEPPQTNWESTPLAVKPKPKSIVQKGQTWTEPTTGMKFVWVPKGCFNMGSSSGESDEKPVHEVCVDGYWMGQTEVTQGQWQKMMGSNPAYFKENGECTSALCPVEQVSWSDSQDFIDKLKDRTGKNFRLPTEAEWEYACRAGGDTKKYAGAYSPDSVAWYDGNSGEKTHRVATKKANALGLYDMSGNVWEWTQDWYKGSAYSSHARNNHIYDAGGQRRVLRGGSWAGSAGYTRCARRLDLFPGIRPVDTGLRLLITKAVQHFGQYGG